MKNRIKLVLQILLLTIILFICTAVSSVIVGLKSSSTNQSNIIIYTFIVCFLNVIMVSYIIKNSKWYGLKLMSIVFMIIFGIQTVMTQLETLYFIDLSIMPPMWKLFASGFLKAICFSPISVMILGKVKNTENTNVKNRSLYMPKSEWMKKLILLSICYVVIYFLFGYIIAWNLPELRQYYATVSNSSVMHQIGSETYQQSSLIANLKAYFIDSDPFIIPFQLFRGLLWTLIAIPVITMLNSNSKKMPIVIGFLYSIMFATLLLIPNAYMPHNIRIAHLYETASSNFLYGIIVASLIMYVPKKRKNKSDNQEIKRIVNSTLVENM